MRKLIYILFCLLITGMVFQGCGEKHTAKDGSGHSDVSAEAESTPLLTEEQAYQGVYNYCHASYDWSIADDNPDIMYLRTGEETKSEYQIVFRSYTGVVINFYVDKKSGMTRLKEYVPALGTENETETINIYDYLE